MTDQYMYGVRYHGRGPFDQWFNSEADAVDDASRTDDKYMPAEIIRIALSAIECTGVVLDFKNGSWERGEREWRTNGD